MPETVGIIGAGLVGCLTAIAFAKKGYNVSLFDYREDPRIETTSDKNLRSINLAISARGIKSLEYIDKEISKHVLRNIVPMKGRMVHDLQGNTTSQEYGLFGECINAIDRSMLNNDMLTEAEKFENVSLNFGYKLTKIDFHSSKQTCMFSTISEPVKFEFDFIIGCDGAFSMTRHQIQREIKMNFAQEYIDCFYIELYIPPLTKCNEEFEGNFAICPNHLHIWPRHDYMLIALPNSDGSFTSTFFGPWSLAKRLNTKETIASFLVENFPDAISLMGLENAVYAFEHHPKASLLSIKCNTYHVDGGKCIIIGDAAHAMVPFYGQGMNCGFEDVRVLMEMMEKHNNDRRLAFEEYSVTRQKDLDAIIDLAKNNYQEMSHKVSSKKYLLRRLLNIVLGKLLKGNWLPLYTMVSFRSDISYYKAVEISKRQDKILNYLQGLILTFCSLGGYKVFGCLYRYFKHHIKS